MLANLGKLYLKCLQKGISMINNDVLALQDLKRVQELEALVSLKMRGRQETTKQENWLEVLKISALLHPLVQPGSWSPSPPTRRCRGFIWGKGVKWTWGPPESRPPGMLKGRECHPAAIRTTSKSPRRHLASSAAQLYRDCWHIVTLGQETRVGQKGVYKGPGFETVLQVVRWEGQGAMSTVRWAKPREGNWTSPSRQEGIVEGSKTHNDVITSAS